MSFFKKRTPPAQEDDWHSLLFARDRRELSDQLQLMTDRAVEMVDRAMAGLKTCDVEMLRTVVDDDQVVDDLEIDIENLCLRALALRQPVREDLRFVFSVIKAITDLERIGDQAVNIALRGQRFKGDPIESLDVLLHMAELSTEMVRRAVAAFISKDAAAAKAVLESDDQVDTLNDQVYDTFMGLVRRHHNDDRLMDRVTDLVLIGRNLERIGDHACNIAGRAWYTVTGERFKEQHGPDGQRHRHEPID